MNNFIIFPNQLFEDVSFIKKFDRVILVEDPLFFSDKERIEKFNAIKLVYQIATFRFYKDYLESKNIKVKYYNFNKNYKNLIKQIKKDNSGDFHMYYPFDKLLQKRYSTLIKKIHNNPHFFDTEESLKDYYKRKNRKLFQTSFYSEQRKKLDILLDKNGKPLGGKLTYDTENRDKLPKDIKIPKVPTVNDNRYVRYARNYVNKNIPYFGNINGDILFPLNFDQTKKWYRNFIKNRLKNFGRYQDAITKRDEVFLFHSAISPAFNVGFITQKWIANEILKSYKKHKIPLSSVEGLIRQIIGWNSFCRAYYVNRDVDMSKNFFNNKKKLNKKWYTGETGLPPVDKVIRSAFDNGYLHHIERLMIMLSIMIMCEIDYREIYRWHMEYSLDSYDYLMIYNIYSMGYGDGGYTTTKPYISSSNYILKMSDYKKGDWCDVWDSLYYNFLDKNRDKLKNNPRMRTMYINYSKKTKKQINEYKSIAKKFIKSVTS